MTLVSHEYGCSLPQPHGIWYQRHTSIDFIFYIFDFRICPCAPDCQPSGLMAGNTTGRHLANAVHGYPKGLADYNLNSILCWSANMCIIIPRLWSWRKASHGFISSIRIRSKWNFCCVLINTCRCRLCLSWRLSCHASTCGNVPVMLVLNYQCTVERTSSIFPFLLNSRWKHIFLVAPYENLFSFFFNLLIRL